MAEASTYHNDEMEQVVLGVMLQGDSQILQQAADFLQPADFYHRDHQALFSLILEMSSEGTPVEEATAFALLKERNIPIGREDGWGIYLGYLNEQAYLRAYFPSYIKSIHEASDRRRIFSSAESALAKAGTAEELASHLGSTLEAHQKRLQSENGAISGAEIFMTVAHWLDEREAQGWGLPGIATGLRDLDGLTGGLQSSELIILGARPSMGKTALALTIARNVALYGNTATLLFSLEMGVRQIGLRILCAEAKVTMGNLTERALEGEAANCLHVAQTRLDSAPLHMIERAPTIEEIQRQAHQFAGRNPLDLMIVDYLQLLQAGRSTENRVQEISAISRGLKTLAIELDIPILALSQINRQPEANTDKRPSLAHLRDSGAIEQDADQVWLLYRPEYYAPDEEAVQGKAEVQVAKNRNGATGKVELAFIKEQMTFRNLATLH